VLTDDFASQLKQLKRYLKYMNLENMKS